MLTVVHAVSRFFIVLLEVRKEFWNPDLDPPDAIVGVVEDDEGADGVAGHHDLKSVELETNSFVNPGSAKANGGTCTIKLITAVIYGFL